MEQSNKNEKIKKISFFKKLNMSIKDFDKYETFTKETIGQTLLYMIKLTAILAIVLTIVMIYQITNNINVAVNEYNERITELTYKNNKLSINDNSKLEIDSLEKAVGKIIIDTSDLDNDQIEEYKKTMSNYDNILVFLNNKILIKNNNLSEITEMNYSDILKSNNDIEDKQAVLDAYNSNKVNIYTTLTMIVFAGIFILYVTNILLDAIVLGFLGYITAKLMKVNLKYDGAFNIAVHSLTLPLILNIIYAVINSLTGFEIKYFQVMYTAISYIYIITAILMMKSDYIKKQVELQKIEDEQQKIKNELLEKEEDKKRKEEKEKVKDRDKEKEKKEKNDNEKEPSIEDKPAGNNV